MRYILRKEALHFTVGTGVGLALLVFPRFPVLVILGASTFILIVFELVRFAVPSVNLRFASWFPLIVRRGEEKRVTGSTYFLVASLVTAIAFPKHIAVLAILFAALGDPIGTVVGSWIRKYRLLGKSLEGHLACFAICLVIGFLLTRALAGLSLAMAIVGAVAATIFEALDLPLNDNVTITLGSAVAMWAASFLQIV